MSLLRLLRMSSTGGKKLEKRIVGSSDLSQIRTSAYSLTAKGATLLCLHLLPIYINIMQYAAMKNSPSP